jgi:hypothetical protein
LSQCVISNGQEEPGGPDGDRSCPTGAGPRPTVGRFRRRSDPGIEGQVISELITEDSAVTGYLAEVVLNTPPPDVRDVLLSTSILDHISAQAASELATTRYGEAVRRARQLELI